MTKDDTQPSCSPTLSDTGNSKDSDEDKAVEILSRNRSIHQVCIEKHYGKLIKVIGYGILASFSLASEAFRYTMEIQKKCEEQDIPLKIGIHEGEMIISGILLS